MPLTWNVDQYIASLRRRAERAKRNTQEVVAKWAAEAFSRIVEGTPVDEGRARASWQLIPINPWTWVIRSEGTPHILVLEFWRLPWRRA